MNISDLSREELLKFAKVFGFGFYRVTEDGEFVECDPKAREVFGIPRREKNLSKYSIAQLHAVPKERERRIKKIKKEKYKPISGTLAIQVNKKHKLVFEICWWGNSPNDNGNYFGLVSDVENSTIFPKMFDSFPMGLYEIDGDSKVVRVNQKMLNMFGYKDEKQVLGRHIKEFYEDKHDLEQFYDAMKEHGYARDFLKLKGANNKTLRLECFTFDIDEFEDARWGMVNDVSLRHGFFDALEKMPTGYYYIKYAKDDSEPERLVQCNDHFVKMLGFKSKADAIGINVAKELHWDEKSTEKFIKDLEDADKKGAPLQNYPFKNKTIDGKTIHVAIDSHLVRNKKGEVIGRAGTIRDMTKEVNLQAETAFKKITADVDGLIHSFIHPVVKVSGISKSLLQMGNILQKLSPLRKPPLSKHKTLGKRLMESLKEVRDTLPDIKLKEKMNKTINRFDSSMQAEKKKGSRDESIRNTAITVLEDFDKHGYLEHEKLKNPEIMGFVGFLQGIVFDHVIRGVSTFWGATELMKGKVEAIRHYIVKQNGVEYTYRECDIGEMLDKNKCCFEPVIKDQGIIVQFDSSGNLKTEISQDDINRVIWNLFHNVQKHSYKGKPQTVKVEAKESADKKMVEFSIQNIGTGIKEDEIKDGKVWQFGYRGILVYDHDRDGPGIGLADAKHVIESHKGEIEITSKPAGDGIGVPEYRIPYIITVTIRLPKKKKEEDH